MGNEQAMREEINRERELHNRPVERDPITGKQRRVTKYEPGDKGYLPPVENFVTIRFYNSTIIIPAEEYAKLSKAKQKKLMKWRKEIVDVLKTDRFGNSA